MTALAIYEKTLGPEHPEVAKDLVNLGNAFCDQNQHYGSRRHVRVERLDAPDAHRCVQHEACRGA